MRAQRIIDFLMIALIAMTLVTLLASHQAFKLERKIDSLELRVDTLEQAIYE